MWNFTDWKCVSDSMAKAHKCCKCWRNSWTRTIIWVQVTYFIFLGLYFVWGLYPKFAHKEDSTTPTPTTPLRPIDDDQLTDDSICKVFLELYLVLVAGLVMGFFMSLFVLKGTCTNEPRQSGVWIIYAILSFTITAALSIGECYLNSNRGFWVTLFAFVVGGCIHGFFIWVIIVHRAEMSHNLELEPGLKPTEKI